MHDPKVETAIQYFADGVIIFTAAWRAEVLSRSIAIKKMRGITFSARRLAYSISKRGFTIETATRIT